MAPRTSPECASARLVSAVRPLPLTSDGAEVTNSEAPRAVLCDNPVTLTESRGRKTARSRMGPALDGLAVRSWRNTTDLSGWPRKFVWGCHAASSRGLSWGSSCCSWRLMRSMRSCRSLAVNSQLNGLAVWL